MMTNLFKRILLNKIKLFPVNLVKKDVAENILIINTVAGHGGAARAAYDMLCKNLDTIGFRVGMICSQSKVHNDQVYVLTTQQNPWQKSIHRIYDYFGFLDLNHKTEKKIKKHKFFVRSDIVHLHNLHGGYFNPMFLPELCSLKPVIWTLHDEQSFTGHCGYSFSCNRWLIGCGSCPDLNYYPRIRVDSTNFLWNLKRNIYKKSDMTLVVPSQWLYGRVKNSMLGEKDVRLIYNGINHNVWQPQEKIPSRRKLKLPEDKKIILFIADGSIHNPQKGGKLVLELAERLKYRDDVLFVIVGHEKEIGKKNMITRGYISDTNDLISYYSSADICIFPTRADNFPFVVLEAMACAVPVVSFNIGGIPEQVEHKRTGYLARYQDIEDFIFGIKMFLDDNQLRETASCLSRKRILQYFSLDLCLKAYSNLYQEVYSRRKI